jgi:hypothetical protein
MAVELVLVCSLDVSLALAVAVAGLCDHVARLHDDSPWGFPSVI